MCNVSKMVNQIFNAQILIYTLTNLLYLSMCIYFTYMDIRRKCDFMDMLAMKMIYLLDSIVGVLKVALMSYDCEYVMRQVRNLFIALLKSMFKYLYYYIFLSYWEIYSNHGKYPYYYNISFHVKIV